MAKVGISDSTTFGSALQRLCPWCCCGGAAAEDDAESKLDARPLLRKVQEAVEGLAPGAKLQSQSVAGVRAEMTFLLPRKK